MPNAWLFFNVGGPEIFCSLIGVLVSFAALGLWAYALVDCLQNEPSTDPTTGAALGNEKLTWVLVLIFLPVLGAALYLFLRRPARIAKHGR